MKTIVRKLSAVIAVLAMTCLLAVGVFADSTPYSISSATIKVGESWSFSVPNDGTYDWFLSSEYVSHGPGLADQPGVLEQTGDTTADGIRTLTFTARQAGECTVRLTDRSMTTTYAVVTVKVTDGSTVTPSTPAQQPAETPAVGLPSATRDETPAPIVDTRTAQQREIDEAKANGTWGIEYTTCDHCGYHNWTRQGNVYVCDTCGNTTTTVVSAKGVKGYVGSGAIAPVAKAAEPETRYATAQQAQAAADQREADYAAAVAAFQQQIAAQNAAYLASLKG